MLELGDISVRKEWTFAGDIAKGIFTLVEQDIVYETVIGSGLPYSIEDWLVQCFDMVGEDWRKHVQLSTSFTPEYGMLVSNPATIHSLGWQATVSFHDLASLMMSADKYD
jgi:GDPmannose 4,6-dehydratase